jgi:predicted RNA-binding protein associated with RNAse of E/G family
VIFRRQAYSGGIHPPKHETFDLIARTNTDPKGIVRAVDVYTVRPWGLYMARPTPGRPQFHYLESWLLPALGLRANVYHFNPGHERDQDFYLDVGEFTAGETVWHAEDHYLDLVVHKGAGTELVDIDELLSAVQHGLLSAHVARQAIQRAVRAIDGLSRHDDDLHRWLAADGLDLTWRGAYSRRP